MKRHYKTSNTLFLNLSPFLLQTGRKEKGDPLNSAIDKMTKKTRDLRRQVSQSSVCCLSRNRSIKDYDHFTERKRLTKGLQQWILSFLFLFFYSCPLPFKNDIYTLRKKVQKLSLGLYLFKRYTFVSKGYILVP